MEAIFGLIFRHVLTAAGTYVAAKGYADSASVEAVGGALATIAGIVWSVVQKKKSGALSPQ
jgi:hypothetical protein